VGHRLLLNTNRKMHKGFQLVSKWMNLDNLERPLGTISQVHWLRWYFKGQNEKTMQYPIS